MCLTEIIPFGAKRFPKKGGSGVGYKIFWYRDDNGELLGYFQNPFKVRPRGKWLKSRDYKIKDARFSCMSGDHRKYPQGWHVYLGKPSGNPADGVSVVVRFRNVVAIGYDSDEDLTKCVVAKEIYIPRERSKTAVGKA